MLCSDKTSQICQVKWSATVSILLYHLGKVGLLVKTMTRKQNSFLFSLMPSDLQNCYCYNQ